MKKIVSAVLTAAMTASLMAAPVSVHADEVVTFDVWHSMEGSNGEAFEAMVSNFNDTVGKELGIKANSVFQGNDTASKLKTLIQAGDTENMPDVCLVYGASLPVVGDYENTVPVDDMYGTGTATLAKEDILPATVQTYTYKGKQICMPFNSSTLLLYYNVDAFNEVGLDPENPPKTLDEIADACEKLTVKDGDNVTRYGFNAELDRYEMVNLVGNQGDGTPFGDNNNGRDGLITEVTCRDQMLNVFTSWQKIAETGGFKYNYDNQNEEFATGANAMTLMSSARIASVTNLTKDSGVNWNVTAIPGIDSSTDKGGAAIGGASLCMFDKGDDAKKTAAWEFIQYAASAETQSTWCQATGYLPINVNTKNLDDYAAYVEANPAVQTALTQFEATKPNVQEPVLMMQGSVDTAIKDAAVYLCEGDLSPEEATDYVIDECNKLFDEYNRANQ